MLLFVASWFMRGSAANAPSNVALTLSFIAVVLALVGGWLGGELVDRLGIGIDEGANPDAPSSLFGRPAIERDIETKRDWPKAA